MAVAGIVMQQYGEDLLDCGERVSSGDDAHVQCPIIDECVWRDLGEVPIPACVADDDLERLASPAQGLLRSLARGPYLDWEGVL
jgi:hypothetical protein